MQNTLTDSNVEYIVRQLREGKGVQIDSHDGKVTGLVGIESGTEFARWVAERAERRASTRNI